MWLLVIGDPGSGKTEIIIQSLRTFPEAQIIGSLTPKCFLSSFKRDKNDTKDHGMLSRGGPSQVWLAQDWTDFAAMKVEDRAQVAATLRKIWDGELTGSTGVDDANKSWRGKVTMLAVAAPGFERHWAVLSDLGERFVTLRWRAGNRADAMSKVRKQAGNEDSIRKVAQEHMQKILEGSRHDSQMPTDDLMRRLDGMAEVICQLRRHVERESFGTREVVEVARCEFPSRVALALSQVVRTHCDLFHKDKAGLEELALGERLATDSIPSAIRQIIERIPRKGGVPYAAISRQVQVPLTTLKRCLDDLILLDVIRPYESKGWGDRVAQFTPDFLEVLYASGLQLQPRNLVLEKPRLLKNRLNLNSIYAVDGD